ncbi:MAG: TIM barrel protein [Solirubrobacterales bacterium]|nr:TIM barrel protein [Solirubrobacterales bacterium]
MAVRLATGPVTWGVDFADTPGNPPWERVLDEIAASGLDALELGPLGYLPEEPAVLRSALDSRGLSAVGSFVFEDLHDPTQAEPILAIARRACAAICAAGGRVLVIIDRPGDRRAQTAGRTQAAPRLGHDAWASMVELIERTAAIATDEGLEPVVHPHAGSHIEFPDEIERLMDATTAGLCVDTGHLAYAGMRAEDVIERYGERVGHVHLKDVDRSILDDAHSTELDFWAAIGAGVFCPLGAGAVDFTRVKAALEGVGYAGYATIEQDRTPDSGTPLEDLKASLRALAAAGVEAGA